MREEIPAYEDVIISRQTRKVVLERGNTENKPRKLVSAAGIIFWHLTALIALHLWLLRLLGYITLPW